MNDTMRKPSRLQSGGATLLVVALILSLTLVASLAVDVGKVMAVRAQLQSAADAAALAGAARFTTTGGLADTGVTAAAQATLTRNQFLNTPLSQANFSLLSWNLDTGKPAGAGDSPTAHLAPALKVVIPLSGSANAGALPLSFGGLFGRHQMELSVSATAIKPPAILPPGSVLPIAIDRCLYEQFWDTAQDAPKSTATVMIYSALVMAQPKLTYSLMKCASGQWSTLDQVNNSATAVQQLLANGNGSAYYLSDTVYIQPGEKASVYDDIQTATANGGNIAGYLPVTEGDLTTKGFLNVVDFVPFAITAGQKKSVPAGVLFNFVSGRPLTAQEAETLIPETRVRDTLMRTPRLVQ